MEKNANASSLLCEWETCHEFSRQGSWVATFTFSDGGLLSIKDSVSPGCSFLSLLLLNLFPGDLHFYSRRSILAKIYERYPITVNMFKMSVNWPKTLTA